MSQWDGFAQYRASDSGLRGARSYNLVVDDIDRKPGQVGQGIRNPYDIAPTTGLELDDEVKV
nr:hypothetical protein [Subtercola boreus]